MRLAFLRRVRPGGAGPAVLTGLSAAWWVACLFIPAALLFFPSRAGTAMDLLRSFDLPIALALAATVMLDARALAKAPGPTDWLWPRGFEGKAVRWALRLRRARPLRWPLGLLCADVLLSLASGTSPSGHSLTDVILVGTLSGLLFASLISTGARRSTSIRAGRTARRSRGGRAVTWAAWHEAWDGFAARRLGVLVIPVLLAAPAGATVRDVVPIVAIYLPLLFVALLCRESLHVHRRLRGWLPSSARWWIASRAWGVVLAAVALTVLVASMLAGIRAPGPAQ